MMTDSADYLQRSDEKVLSSRTFQAFPETVDTEKRTVTVLFLTEAPVAMSWWDHPDRRERKWTEILSMDPAHIRLERAKAGAFHSLNNHRRGDVEDVLARAVPNSVEITPEGLQISLKFRDTPKADEVFQSIADGSWGGWSALYKVSKYEPVSLADTDSCEPDVYRAIDWEPVSADPVCIPADYTAGARAHHPEPSTTPKPKRRNDVDEEEITTEANLNTQSDSESERSDATGSEQPPNTGDEPNPPEIDQAEPEARSSASARAAEIVKMFTGMGLPIDEATSLLERNATLSEARKRAVALDIAKKKAAGKDVKVTSHRPSIRIEKRSDIVNACVDAMVLKSQGELETETDLAKKFRRMPVLEILKRGIKAHGSDWSDDYGYHLYTRLLTTSFFKESMAEFVRRRTGVEYRGPRRNYEGLCLEVDVADFRPIQVISAQEAMVLEKSSEAKEVNYTSIAYVEGESYKLATFRGGIEITYEVFVNDDLGNLAPKFRQIGAASTRLHRELIIEPLVLNKFKVRGKTIFHADHKNILEAAEFNLDTYDECEQLLWNQVGPNKKHEQEYDPAFLLHSRAMKKEVLKQYTEVGATSAENLNLRSIYEESDMPRPRVITEFDRADRKNDWILLASPRDIPTLHLAYLMGEKEPVLTKQEITDNESVKSAWRLNIGVNAVDYRGAALAHAPAQGG